MNLKDIGHAIVAFFSGNFGETVHTVVAAAKKFAVDELQQLADIYVEKNDGTHPVGTDVFKIVFDELSNDVKVAGKGLPGWLLGLVIHTALGKLRLAQAEGQAPSA